MRESVFFCGTCEEVLLRNLTTGCFLQTENHYKSIIEDLSNRLKAEQEIRTNTEMKLEKMTSLKDSCVAKLNNLKEGFIAFVEKSRPDFSQGQADFLIPQIDIELEKE